LGRTDCNARAPTPKDFKHVRPALEHFVALEVLERERKPGRKANWLYRKAKKIEEKVITVENMSLNLTYVSSLQRSLPTSKDINDCMV
jgi:pyruvate/2-oxoacid:ferredoxin oxidoreductase alpha subunit